MSGTIEFVLHPNALTPDTPNDQVARPVNTRVRGFEDLVEKMTGPGSILKPLECRAVHRSYWEGIMGFIRAGEAYSDKYITIRFGISGVFTDENDRYDLTRHTLFVSINLKALAQDALSGISLKHVDAESLAPNVENVYDWTSDTHDKTITAGGVVEITGERLKIENNLETEGIFFIKQADNSETQVTRLRTNHPSKLTILVPTLAKGDYRIEVRNTRHNGTALKTGLFPPLLQVK